MKLNMRSPRIVRFGLFALAIAVMAGISLADDSPTTRPTTGPIDRPTTGPAMESHTLVLLILSDSPPTLDAEASAALQSQHMAHIKSMGETGKVLVAGPFAQRDDQALRGMLIFSCPIEEARAMANKDPAVKAGRLKVVCMTWMTEKGAMTFAAETNPAR